jgi:polyisoprenoid-binding protein YceI
VSNAEEIVFHDASASCQFIHHINNLQRINTMPKSLIALLIGGMLFTSARAQSVWKTDKAHSNVDFTVAHLVIAEVRGSFRDFEATLVSDKPDLSDMKLEATIKTASVFTDNEARDKHLRSNDFFNADSFPNIIFKSTSVKKRGKDSYAITGNLTIRDVTKPVVLETIYRGSVVDPWGNTKAGFTATTTIDRFAFGTTWNKTIETGGLVVGKDVNIRLAMQFVRQKPEEKK